MLSRAINGCVESVTIGGAVSGEKHRYDNRLSMAVLTRLDRLAAGQGDREEQLLAVSEDFEDLLDLFEADGDADAFVGARDPDPDAAAHADDDAAARRTAPQASTSST